MREAIEIDVEDFENPELEKGVYARFYFVPIRNEAESIAEGRPVFKDAEYVEIIAAGNQNNIIRRPAREPDIRRFRKQYELFKKGDMEQLVGTPLVEIPWLTRSQVEELMYRKIRTVENLANVSDTECSIPGMFDLRKKAKEWLEKAKGESASAKEVAELKAQLAAMQEQMAQMAKANAGQQAAKKEPSEDKKA